MRASRGPLGVSIERVSPLRAPASAEPTGESIDSRPLPGSASAAGTSVNVRSSPPSS